MRGYVMQMRGKIRQNTKYLLISEQVGDKASSTLTSSGEDVDVLDDELSCRILFQPSSEGEVLYWNNYS